MKLWRRINGLWIKVSANLQLLWTKKWSTTLFCSINSLDYSHYIETWNIISLFIYSYEPPIWFIFPASLTHTNQPIEFFYFCLVTDKSRVILSQSNEIGAINLTWSQTKKKKKQKYHSVIPRISPFCHSKLSIKKLTYVFKSFAVTLNVCN